MSELKIHTESKTIYHTSINKEDVINALNVHFGIEIPYNAMMEINWATTSLSVNWEINNR